MNRRWICSDVWLDILPSFDHAQLGLKMALISPRFDALVDEHFEGKTELTLWNEIRVRKHIETPKLFVEDKSEGFPLPDHPPLPNKIRFDDLQIEYIDHSVITFLRSNHQIFNRSGTNLDLAVFSSEDEQPIWDVFVRQIWPIFATNIRYLQFADGDHLDNLLRRTSPTILTDLDINSIKIFRLFAVVIAATDDDDDDGPNATSAGQALAKWLHTPKKDGQSKQLFWGDFKGYEDFEWINNFKEVFVRARTSVSYAVHFINTHMPMPIVPFELVNERTKEMLTLMKDGAFYWVLKRCPIVGETAAVQQPKNWTDNLNNVFFDLSGCNNLLIGPLSPPATAAKADQSSEKGV